MKKVSMILAAMMMASPAVYAQQTQQQTPVPAKRVGTEVAQVGTFTSPGSTPAAVAPAAAPAANMALIVLGAAAAGVTAVSANVTTSH